MKETQKGNSGISMQNLSPGRASEKSENLQGDSDLYKENVYQISINSNESSYVKLYKLSDCRILKFGKPEN